MLDRTAERFGLKPQHLAADSAYGSAENLAWLVKERQIAPHIPVIDKADRTDGTFSRSDFVYDPDGGSLHLSGRQAAGAVPAQLHGPAHRDHQGRNHASTTPSNPIVRAVTSSPAAAPTRPGAGSHAIWMKTHVMSPGLWRGTPAFERSRHHRKKIEMLFAHLKRILRLARLRLRGPSGARDEFLLAATAQNLRRLAKLRPMPAFAGAGA